MFSILLLTLDIGMTKRWHKSLGDLVALGTVGVPKIPLNSLPKRALCLAHYEVGPDSRAWWRSGHPSAQGSSLWRSSPAWIHRWRPTSRFNLEAWRKFQCRYITKHLTPIGLYSLHEKWYRFIWMTNMRVLSSRRFTRSHEFWNFSPEFPETLLGSMWNSSGGVQKVKEI